MSSLRCAAFDTTFSWLSQSKQWVFERVINDGNLRASPCTITVLKRKGYLIQILLFFPIVKHISRWCFCINHHPFAFSWSLEGSTSRMTRSFRSISYLQVKNMLRLAPMVCMYLCMFVHAHVLECMHVRRCACVRCVCAGNNLQCMYQNMHIL